MKAIKWVVQIRRVRNQHGKLPSRLWFVLALPSAVVFVAWPLSGLCLEMTSGFLHGKVSQGKERMLPDSFNQRSTPTLRVGGHPEDPTSAHVFSDMVLFTHLKTSIDRRASS